MKIAIGSDHAGFELKNHLKEVLFGKGLDVQDLGCADESSVDYPDYAEKVCTAVLTGKCQRGILVCGSGVGMSIAANRFKGIRAVLAMNDYLAEFSRRHNDSNVLCLPGRLLEKPAAEEIVRIWLETAFEGGRHERRVKKLDDLG
ncbi:MAG TPA: ribose 5-phosphate isomerase B [Acidobacteriota bacterium]|nr:ribose 5-phosphate isomerase B [Acidobacteriota bacterium]HNT18573.1 ribose 5-phosphate isomerase B [Acidobacteriota bacterium]HPA27758.1 ribose 5-phosphate isomerase B [Acidobacteriota bacterium]HQO20868.1 ribose 5-phosphate isomerase B [Acidobacteriota bacterium]HQQ47631.1 ribose 5-phosphate isomerase B [Acidobacteriota bacterium]